MRWQLKRIAAALGFKTLSRNSDLVRTRYDDLSSDVLAAFDRGRPLAKTSLERVFEYRTNLKKQNIVAVD